ncbi:type I-E CRISPR-associated protein Cse2/CasB [Synechococcus sp. C9]|jgi:CRISPR type I-E-associated protein CasB/Cse2|uniref:type I-E CRISPR-associated protein Cse2/CasB n=1 Tax=Synechococcus sp. C9 TaxID=102119 RepID=UPI001FF26094|nr:type I-E CRISPR-associated protein Cse2/CasB [Synechococcus sp. C9]
MQPFIPQNLDPIALGILNVLTQHSESNYIILGEYFALKHYLDYRDTNYHDQKKEPAPRNFAQSCLDLHNSGDSKGPERRFRSLLDTDLVDIQSPITALVRQIKSKKDRKIEVYYPELIADLRNWDPPDQFIQDKWAKTFWGVASSPDIPVEETEEEV